MKGGNDEAGQRHLGRAIRVLRQRAGLTQAELGRRAKLHKTWICHIEAGEVNLTWGNLRRLAEGLDIALADLLRLAEDHENAEVVGIAVRSIRRERGYTQSDVAKRAGLTPGLISQVEKGSCPLTDRKRLAGKLRRGLRIQTKAWNEALDAAQVKAGTSLSIAEATSQPAGKR